MQIKELKIKEPTPWPFPTIIKEPNVELESLPVKKIETKPAPLRIVPGGGDNKVTFAHNLDILFLDFDGVLNSCKMSVITGSVFFASEPDENGKCVRHIPGIDKYAVALINKVCEVTDSKIVVISSWRKGRTLKQLSDIFVELGLNPQYLIGKVDDNGESKGQLIEEYMAYLETRNGPSLLYKKGLIIEDYKDLEKVRVTNYAIVDDEPGQFQDYQVKYKFVHSSAVEGLTLMNAVRIGQLLSNDDTFYIKALSGKPFQGSDKYVQ